MCARAHALLNKRGVEQSTGTSLGAVQTAKAEIAARIRPVCEHFCEEEFDALVDRMAEIDVRYRLRHDWTLNIPDLNELGIPQLA
jgi:hypothetical protein